MVKITSSEEENTEFLANIWNKYKYLLILAITLVVAGILGWESLSKSQTSSEQIVSDLYKSYIDIKDKPDEDSGVLAAEIIKSYPNTLYADLVTLHLAKLEVDKNNLGEATKYLQGLLEKHSSTWNKNFDPIESTARQRLARVLIEDNKPKEALDIVIATDIFDQVLYEIKGDAENLLGLKEEAKLSYLQAIASTQNQSIQALLRMKLADLEIKE